MNRSAATAILASLLALGCKSSAPKQDLSAPQVEGDRVAFPAGAPQLDALTTRPVEEGNRTALRLTGRLIWDEDATVRVYSPVAGRVSRLTAETGQAVGKGTVLAWMESPDVGQAQSDAVRTATDLQAAERNLARIRALFEHGAAARKELEAAESDVARSGAESQRAHTRLALFSGEGGPVDQRCALRSPIPGVVVDRALNPGQEVRPDAPAPLFVVSDPSRLWVQLDVTEQQLPLLKKGLPLKLRAQAYPGKVFTGRLDILGETLDPATRTVKARGSVPNPGRALKAEMYVDVEVESKGNGGGAFLPSGAVVNKGDGAFVFVQEAPGRFRRVAVVTGPEQGGRVEVLKGVAPGQRVVVEGGLLLETAVRAKA